MKRSEWLPKKNKFINFQSKTLVAPILFNMQVTAEMCLELTEKQCIDEAARILRRAALNVNIKKLNINNILNVSLEKGEVFKMPWQILRFYEKIFKSERSQTTQNYEQKLYSASNDFIYIVNNGRIKTNKQLMLGMFVKSIYRSR